MCLVEAGLMAMQLDGERLSSEKQCNGGMHRHNKPVFAELVGAYWWLTRVLLSPVSF